MDTTKDAPAESMKGNLPSWILDPIPVTVRKPEVQKLGIWTEIRLFISSTFVDTHAERDILIKHVIPNINRKLSERLIRLVPVDLRWGTLAEETKDCKAIQKTCLNQIDKCRQSAAETPWFIGLRTERYGWVQDELMPSHGFEKPGFYSWIDKLNNKLNFSITSLECMHAVQAPKELPPSPTVFFYERVLENPENIEDNLKWLFDFEYVGPNAEVDCNVKFQYKKTEDHVKYKSDQKELNQILKNLSYTKYSQYQCRYNKGGARYTCKKENEKSSGVAYVDGLQKFQDKVEVDLLYAIQMNFEGAVSKEVPQCKLDNIPHEISIQEKASVFVGRAKLLKTGKDYCTNKSSESNHNVMIIHGKPGCGKSGLLSAIAQKCLREIPEKGDFLFTHVVDSSPGSNVLEQMLKRLQLNLRYYRKELGEVDMALECSASGHELKRQHHEFLEETANKYPDKQFVVIVDAVNQMHESLQAWTMWWLPRQSCPKNVRFMITTLNKENGTFENACKVSHNAVYIPVQEMRDEDLKEMITTTLGKFNKKLTVTGDNEQLGNQMELLISKNKSPLYIKAACEALRKFGIYEEVSGYIQKFPSNVQDLFSFLLDEWSEEYGKEIVEDVAGFFYVSREGLLETEINDLLQFKENALKDPDALLYQSSFSRLYDSLSSFLSSGGGGYLRYFHDQLKYTVKKKYMDVEGAERLFHEWLFKFYYDMIEEQIQLKPNKEPCAYYEHALQQIVYHQLQSVPPKELLSYLHLTLRNLYFVRERVTNNQTHVLNQEYMDAIEKSNSDEEIMALREWARFAQVYASTINEFPEFCYNMAINQSVTSKVRVDAERLPAPAWKTGFPFIWENNPNEIDPMIVTYSCGIEKFYDYVNCVASTTAGDICCAATGKSVSVIFDQSSGEVLQEMKVDGCSLALSQDCESVWIGEKEGYLSLWDVNSGTMISKTDDHLDGCIVWLELLTDEWLLCGTGSWDHAICWYIYEKVSQIALFNVNEKCFPKRWSTQSPGFCFCYHKNTELIFSGHKGFIKAWNLVGDLQFTLVGAGECVYSLCAHPNEDILLSGSKDSKIRQWSITNRELSHSFFDPYDSVWGFGGNWCVQYDAQGMCILSTHSDSHSLRVYTLEGILQDEMKGHNECITSISLVPGVNQVLTADRDGKLVLWNVPPLQKGKVKNYSESFMFCEFLSNGDEYITLSKTFIRVWETNIHTPVRSANLKIETDGSSICGAVHPSGEYFALGKRMDIYWYKLSDLVMSHSFRALDVSTIGDSVKGAQREIECSIGKMQFSPDGSKLIVLELRNEEREKCHVIVFDITDIMEPKHLLCSVTACDFDIHSDSVHVVTSGWDIRVWSIVTGETFHHFKVEDVCARFLSQTQKLLCGEWTDDYVLTTVIRDLNDNSNIITLAGQRSYPVCPYENESLLVSAGEDRTIRVFDTNTGKCLYGFFHSQAQKYTSLAIHPSNKLILAANSNGIIYALKPEQYCTEN